MKANKAPEKIYIQSFNVSEEEAKFNKSKQFFDDVWTEEPESGHENIEYIRKDAFIEKAAQWLFNQANIYTDIEIDRNNGGVYTKFHADEMVKDFIKAMNL